MVHALKDAWRVLAPGGTLLDLRPFAARYRLELVTSDGAVPVGWTDTTLKADDDAAADAAVNRVLNADLFAARSRVEFDVELVWKTVRDLEGFAMARQNTRVTPSYDELQRAYRRLAAGSAAQLRTTRRVLLTALRRP